MSNPRPVLLRIQTDILETISGVAAIAGWGWQVHAASLVDFMRMHLGFSHRSFRAGGKPNVRVTVTPGSSGRQATVLT
jgi:hypothetical protein